MSFYQATNILLFSIFSHFNPRGAHGLILRTSRLARHSQKATIPFAGVDFEKCTNLAKAVLGASTDPGMTLVQVSFLIANYESKIIQLDIDLERSENEKRLALERAGTKELEALVTQKPEFNEVALRHYYSKKLSFFSMRNVLEIFFAHVVRKYNSGDQEFVKAIDEADKSGEFKKIAKKVNPKMSAVNKILLNEAVWRAVRAKLRIFATIKFPNLEPSLIHGVLSYETIDPDAIDRITISIKADESTKVFFKTLADIFSKKYITFDEKLSNLVNESEN